MSVRTLIEKIGRENLLENFNQTDKSLKEVVSGEIGANLVEQLAQKYDVDSDYFSDLMMLLSLFVSKSINTQEFVNEISVFVPQKYFPQFLQELEDKLWSPYDVYLNKAGVVYKQLTKLTPTPLSNVAGAFDAPPVVEEPTSAPAQLTQEQVQSGKQPSVTQLQPITTQLPVTTELPPTESRVLDNVGAKVPEMPKAPESSKTTTDSQLPITESKPVIISDIVSAPGIKTVPEIPIPPAVGRETPVASEARVKFDAPRVGPRIFKSTESAITPKASEVKFVGPEIKPEVSANVPPASSQWQRPEEKIVEIPKPPEVKKTEVAGRQVIDLTNFGLSKPDEE